MLLGYLLLMFPPILLLACFVCLPYFLGKRRRKKIPFVRCAVIVLFWTMLFSVLAITVFLYGSEITFHPEQYMLNLTPFMWLEDVEKIGMRMAFQQYFYNILMFMPFGFFLPLTFHACRFRHTVACGFALTCSVEIFQYFTGRSADIDDVIANTLGAILGYLIYLVAEKLMGRTSLWKKAAGKEI